MLAEADEEKIIDMLIEKHLGDVDIGDEPVESKMSFKDYAKDVGKSVATGLASGAIDTLAFPLETGFAVGKYLAKKALGADELDFDVLNEPYGISRRLKEKLGLDYKPETFAGKAIKTTSELLPSIAGYAKLPLKTALAYSAISGVPAEAADYLFEKDKENPLLKTAVMIGAPLAFDKVKNIAQNAPKLIKNVKAGNQALTEMESELLGTTTGGSLKSFSEWKNQINKEITDLPNDLAFSVKDTGKIMDDIWKTIAKFSDEKASGTMKPIIDTYKELFKELSTDRSKGMINPKKLYSYLNRFWDKADSSEAKVVVSKIDDIIRGALSDKTKQLVSKETMLPVKANENELLKLMDEMSRAKRYEGLFDIIKDKMYTPDDLRNRLFKFLSSEKIGPSGKSKSGFTVDELKEIEAIAKADPNRIMSFVGKLFGATPARPSSDIRNAWLEWFTRYKMVPFLSSLGMTAIDPMLGLSLFGGGTLYNQLRQRYNLGLLQKLFSEAQKPTNQSAIRDAVVKSAKLNKMVPLSTLPVAVPNVYNNGER